MDLSDAIDELRSLNESVRKPLRLPTEAEVAQAEKKLNLRFHPDYRYFLLHGSDISYGTLEPAIVTPNAGARDLIATVHEARETGVPEELLPFCDSNGDYYCLHRDGTITYWSPDGETNDSWPDLAHWIHQVWIEEENSDEDDEEDENY
jgi:hypothetical protein